MDAVKGEGRKAAASLRRPLETSEKNIVAKAGRMREVASRFKPGVLAEPAAAASPARRCTSPCRTRALAAEGTVSTKKAPSAERRRSSTPSGGSAASRSITPVRNAAAATEVHSISRRAASTKPPDGLWASARSSSPLLQPESVAMATTPAKKRHKLVPGPSSDQTKVQARTVSDTERKRSPLRGKNIVNQCENARPSETHNKRVVEQHRWPAAMVSGHGSAGLTSRSNGLSDTGIRSVTSSNPSRGHSPRRIYQSEVTANGQNQPLNGLAKRLAMNESRMEHKAESSSDVSSQTSEGSKSATRQSRTLFSPVPILHRSSSPNKVLSAASSTATAFQSPLRTRPLAPGRSRCCSTGQSVVVQPVFNYIVDARKGKKNASQMENIHQLRLLYNRYLQWQFVNDRSENTLSFQKKSVETILYSVWKSFLKLRDSVTVRRIDVQLLQQDFKLYYILKEQIAYLEHWPALEEENGSTLIGAVEALQACTLRLPVTTEAQADAVAIKNALSSAVDVMQALSSSILNLLSKVEGRTSLVSELSDMAGQEKVTLGECRELLSMAAKLQVQESSLRTHLMQLREGVLG
ncbi:hypothetical protein GUJ93_ZPchr0010g10154 [Zizania palustris]|uniref:Uncharacterized protein n=1 Tax=Zizania palustris TaxID=103762 RepID=A0A8J5WFW1_ZIZPA|nr:hypothetical protein GUJ93_ZPchr0010g10154 [Zizania palustris]KAG8087534.1 hypothetical protein GUJ93_ZPchr0010g10154 [Zizania palustris]KAG8087535.1 hypothetical protein GUJ93_ZPchr0010g10154 [Zizania palustris]